MVLVHSPSCPGEAEQPCSGCPGMRFFPAASPAPAGTPLSSLPERDRISSLNTHLCAQGCSSVRYQPPHNQHRTQHPPIALGQDRGPPQVEGWPERGCGASARLWRAAETPKQAPLTGSTQQTRFRLLSVRFVPVPSPRHRLLSPPRAPVPGLLVWFGFFVISVNILNCKCCLVLTIAHCFGRCFFTMHTNILWLLYMNIFNDT